MIGCQIISVATENKTLSLAAALRLPPWASAGLTPTTPRFFCFLRLKLRRFLGALWQRFTSGAISKASLGTTKTGGLRSGYGASISALARDHAKNLCRLSRPASAAIAAVPTSPAGYVSRATAGLCAWSSSDTSAGKWRNSGGWAVAILVLCHLVEFVVNAPFSGHMVIVKASLGEMFVSKYIPVLNADNDVKGYGSERDFVRYGFGERSVSRQIDGDVHSRIRRDYALPLKTSLSHIDNNAIGSSLEFAAVRSVQAIVHTFRHVYCRSATAIEDWQHAFQFGSRCNGINSWRAARKPSALFKSGMIHGSFCGVSGNSSGPHFVKQYPRLPEASEHQNERKNHYGRAVKPIPPIARRTSLFFIGILVMWPLVLLGFWLDIFRGRRWLGWSLVSLGSIIGFGGLILLALTPYSWSWDWWL
jgi:hypothetical protein